MTTSPTTIAIYDRSTTSGMDHAAMQRLATALTHQLYTDVRPAYDGARMPKVIAPATPPAAPTAGVWPIVAFDDPDQAGALGYHDVDPATSEPYGRIFVRPTRDAGVELSTVWSHEVIEAAVDARCDMWASTGAGWLVAYEACDPVEADSYAIGNVQVSNFVTAAWFDPDAPAGARFDHLGRLQSAGAMSPGGYMIRMNAGKITTPHAEQRIGKVTGAPQPSRSEWRIIRELAR